MNKAEYGHELNVGDIIEVSEISGQGTRVRGRGGSFGLRISCPNRNRRLNNPYKDGSK